MTYYIYQQHENGYLVLDKEVTADRLTKVHRQELVGKYGSFNRFIYTGWNTDSKSIFGWLYIKNLNPIRTVKTYIFKQKL